MDYTMMIYVVLAVIGAGALWGVNQKQFKAKGAFRNFMMIGGIALLAYGALGALGAGGVIELGGADAIFLTATGVQPQVIVQKQVQVAEVVGVKQRPISTLSAISTVKNSNSHTSVAGYLRIFDADTNPSDPTASNLDSITLASGVGSTTNKYVKTSTAYRVVFDGDGTYYDKDFGVMTFPDEDFNPSTGEFLFDLGKIVLVATIDDMIDETATAGLMNGQAANTQGTTELFGTTDGIEYDESVGDGQFYFQPTLSASTAYAELRDAVLCFEWDTTNAPEGNEISSIVAQLQSGTDFRIPSELVNYWSTEECVSLGSMTAGQSSTMRFTITLDETALDTGDDWYMGFDDLGSLRGKDLNLDTGATIDRIKFTAVA